MGINPLGQLIRRFSRLPGLGPRSARRVVLFLLKNRQQMLLPLMAEMTHVAEAVKACQECGNLDLGERCTICRDNQRDRDRLCVIEDVSDLWAIERAGIFSGLYHVLGGTLSAIDGRGPEELGISHLLTRIDNLSADGEVILATSATVDGQTTAHYIAEKLEAKPIKITRLAHGVPVGGELNYLDDGTLAQAMKARVPL